MAQPTRGRSRKNLTRVICSIITEYIRAIYLSDWSLFVTIEITHTSWRSRLMCWPPFPMIAPAIYSIKWTANGFRFVEWIFICQHFIRNQRVSESKSESHSRSARCFKRQNNVYLIDLRDSESTHAVLLHRCGNVSVPPNGCSRFHRLVLDRSDDLASCWLIVICKMRRKGKDF